MPRPKRVAAIHDLSSFGRCSLSVIMPALSAMGVQVCPVPTVLLSSHTGGFSGFAVHECENFVPGCLKHWRHAEIEMECVYSGFLGSAQQIDFVIDYIRHYSDALAVVDPVLGDDGQAYQTITDDLIRKMRELVRHAAVITPNPTEVSLLLGTPFSQKPQTLHEAKESLVSLCALGPRIAVITGRRIEEYGMCNAVFDSEKGVFFLVPCEVLPVSYPGTGDIFASVFTGALLRGDSLTRAVSLAAAFVEQCIAVTAASEEPARNGVFIESVLPMLWQNEVADRALII